MLLADVLENLRKMCLEIYELDLETKQRDGRVTIPTNISWKIKFQIF